MNNEITIKASDGKIFTGILDKCVELRDKVQKYEDELKAKKEKEEQFKKDKEEKLAELNNRYKEFCKLYEEYEANTGESLYISCKDGKYTIKEAGHDDYFSRHMRGNWMWF